jgi:hypothetical protein
MFNWVSRPDQEFSNDGRLGRARVSRSNFVTERSGNLHTVQSAKAHQVVNGPRMTKATKDTANVLDIRAGRARWFSSRSAEQAEH